MLERIREFNTLSIPYPIYQSFQNEEPRKVFSGYEKIDGEPFWNKTFLQINEEECLQRLVVQLAQFLKELHQIPLHQFEDILQSETVDSFSEMDNLYSQLKEHVFPFVRDDARKSISASFESHLSEKIHFEFTPCLVHGDFGMTNILYSSVKKEISGVIDFGGVSIGDPAYDFAGILSSYREKFLRRFSTEYPDLDMVIERMHFYKSTFALQEALFGILNRDKQAFEQGIKEYV
ncbi:phosphotransferase family protein [Bacillus pseudomycoides]|uniref:phosphotransferase family protein n=1 Tax=Bacillus pseudomycoides TaxID=64104 RepID=UPI0020D205E9|nr:aminoglycoside phosphotransferase family protein [Bacillus pseudomycoides]